MYIYYTSQANPLEENSEWDNDELLSAAERPHLKMRLWGI